MATAKALSLLTLLNSIKTDALSSVTSGTYDPTKTNLVNRIIQSTLTGAALSTIGPAPVINFDTIDLPNGLTPGTLATFVDPQAGSTLIKGFILHAITASNIPITYFTYDYQTRVLTYVGRILATLPSGTHTLRAFYVDDNTGSTTGWKLFIATTNTTTTNGGAFMVNAVAASQFVQVSFPTVSLATTGDTQASNRVFFLQETGGTNNMTAAIGFGLDFTNKILYVGNTTTNTIFYKFTYSTAITTVGAGTGITSDLYNFKTGAVSTFGVALLNLNNMKFVTPKSGLLANQACIYVSTAATGYHVPVTDILTGVTTFPNMIQWNKLGTGVDYTAPTYALSVWSNGLDCEFNYSTTGLIMMKRAINNDPNMRIFGKGDVLNNEAAMTLTPQEFPGMTVSSIGIASGLLFAVNSGTGQRGLDILDVTTDQYWVSTYPNIAAPSYIISPVLSAPIGVALAMAIVAEYNRKGLAMVVQFRTSNFSVFPGTWLPTADNGDFSSVGGLQGVSQVQFRFLPITMSYTSVNARQMNEAYLVYTALNEISANWEGSVDNTTANATTPTRTAFRLQTAYTSVVPTLYFRAYDDSGNLVASANTASNPTLFEYTTNNGTSWNSLGTIPNTALTTEVRYNWASPPGVAVTCSIRES